MKHIIFIIFTMLFFVLEGCKPVYHDNPCSDTVSINATLLNGVITVSIFPSDSYTYSINGSSFQNNNVFANNYSNGQYEITCIRDLDSCTWLKTLYLTEGNDTIPTNDCPATVTDVDGNTYNVIKIGNKCWTKENLKTSHYRDLSSIPNITDPLDWSNLTSGAWCNYENNTTHGNTYGKLYNWYAVNDPRGLAPAGWHVATIQDYLDLLDTLGVQAGAKMKAISPEWYSNDFSDNSSGFSALPGGEVANGSFSELHLSAFFWTSDEANDSLAKWVLLNFNSTSLNIYAPNNKVKGFSIRCVKN